MPKSLRLTLHSPVSTLSGVGPAISDKLNKQQIFTIGDFLFVLPNKYQDRTQITPIAELVYSESAQLSVQVISARIQYGRQRTLLIQASDDTGLVSIRLFNFSHNQVKSFSPGVHLLVYGQALTSKGQWAMMHPEYQFIKPDEPITLSQSLTAVYPTISGIGGVKISRWVDCALSCLLNETLLDFPQSFLDTHHLSDLATALQHIHRPAVGEKIDDLLDPSNPDLARIVLDELLSKQIGMLRKKAAIKSHSGYSMTISDTRQAVLLSQLSFNLTKAQLRVIGEIFADLQRPTPMHRLLQGDVGSGKTLVAFSAALQSIDNGLQSVVMAPTEILAEQHYFQAEKLLSPLGIKITWLSGKTTAKQRKSVLSDIADGSAQLVIGTHALFQEDVHYHRLGLVIIDEQHRFGVHQRLLLKEKARHQSAVPDLLVMTATPIPRTLAMSFYADLDTSVIDELPPNRQTIETLVLADSRRHELVLRVKHIVEQGQQVYWVCPLIDESELLEAQAAQDLFEQLQQQLSELNIALLHGRQKPAEKAQIMQDFQSNIVQVLVSTTVIEVGVDVPNASLMIIENAERFGLAQLHQLRGRVGRGAVKSYCVLLYQPPLSAVAKTRLHVIRNQHDGFEIAKQDLQIRGAGEVLGTRQTGEMLLKIADLNRDQQLVTLAYDTAQQLLATNDPLAETIVNRWVGQDEAYLDV